MNTEIDWSKYDPKRFHGAKVKKPEKREFIINGKIYCGCIAEVPYTRF